MAGSVGELTAEIQELRAELSRERRGEQELATQANELAKKLEAATDAIWGMGGLLFVSVPYIAKLVPQFFIQRSGSC